MTYTYTADLPQPWQTNPDTTTNAVILFGLFIRRYVDKANNLLIMEGGGCGGEVGANLGTEQYSVV